MMENPLKPYYQPSVFSTDVVMVRALGDLPALSSDGTYIQLANYTTYCFDGTVRLPRGVCLRLGLNNVICARVRSQGGIVGNTSVLQGGLVCAHANCGDFFFHDISVSQEGLGPVWDQSVDSTGITRWDRMLVTCAGGAIGTFRFAATIVTNTIALGFGDGILLDQAPAGVGFVFEDNSFVQAVGTGGNAVIDLGDTVFGGIRFLHSTVSPALNGFALSGLVNSGNLPVGGIATVLGTRFTGAGTALQNIVVDDIRWAFISPQAIRGSLTYGQVQISANAAATGLAAAGTGVWVDVAGASVFRQGAPRFDNGGANNCKLQYEGEFPAAPRVRVDILLTKAAAGTNDLGVRITKNGAMLGQPRTFPLTAAALGRSLSFEEVDPTMVGADLYGVQLADFSVVPADVVAVNVDLIVSTP